jgi:ABC-type phosphate/phosphonate transport system substrate-binding protein
VRVIGWTPASPCLPFVTSKLTGEATLQALRSALVEMFADGTLAQACELLLLEGVDLEPDETFARVLRLEVEARQRQYPVLL